MPIAAEKDLVEGLERDIVQGTNVRWYGTTDDFIAGERIVSMFIDRFLSY